MRIEWKEDNARAVAVSLARIQQELEHCLSQARQVETALKETDPDGTNKRIKGINGRFEAAVGRLNRIAEDTAELENATNYMIRSFENSESDVIRLLNNLDPGHGTKEGMGETTTGYAPTGHIIAHAVPPIIFPRPRIAPVMRFGKFRHAFFAEGCGISKDGAEAGAYAFYADGVGRQSGSRVWSAEGIFWDCTGPELTVELAKNEEEKTILTGRTDGVMLTIDRNGTELGVQMNEDGSYYSEGFELVMGDTYTVRSYDAVGNVAEQVLSTASAPDQQLGEVWPEDDSAYTRDDVLSIHGWYAVKEEGLQVELALYNVEWKTVEKDGKSEEEEVLKPVGKPIEMSSLERMSDESLQTHLNYWENDTDVTVGYSFDAQVPISAFNIKSTGQYKIVLRWFDKGENTYYIICTNESPFIVRAGSRPTHELTGGQIYYKSITKRILHLRCRRKTKR